MTNSISVLQIERFDQLHRDQLVCVSTTRSFTTTSERQYEVEIKANWSRTRNQFGDQATDIRVNSTVASVSRSVDPFGPPLLTMEDSQKPLPVPKQPVAPAPTYRRLAIEQPAAPPRPAPAAMISEVPPSPTITKESLSLSEDDDESDSEIERIINAEDDQVTSSRPMSSKREARPQSPLAQLFASKPAAAAPRPAPSIRVAPRPSQKSDSDEDDDFISMLKRK